MQTEKIEGLAPHFKLYYVEMNFTSWTQLSINHSSPERDIFWPRVDNFISYRAPSYVYFYLRN